MSWQIIEILNSLREAGLPEPRLGEWAQTICIWKRKDDEVIYMPYSTCVVIEIGEPEDRVIIQCEDLEEAIAKLKQLLKEQG